jgi:hypothetical protein
VQKALLHRSGQPMSFASWLHARRVSVVFDGVLLQLRELCGKVLQGSAFWSDATDYVDSQEVADDVVFQEVVPADDSENLTAECGKKSFWFRQRGAGCWDTWARRAESRSLVNVGTF